MYSTKISFKNFIRMYIGTSQQTVLDKKNTKSTQCSTRTQYEKLEVLGKKHKVASAKQKQGIIRKRTERFR